MKRLYLFLRVIIIIIIITGCGVIIITINGPIPGPGPGPDPILGRTLLPILGGLIAVLGGAALVTLNRIQGGGRQ
jgi:hypothetical protein